MLFVIRLKRDNAELKDGYWSKELKVQTARPLKCIKRNSQH